MIRWSKSQRVEQLEAEVARLRTGVADRDRAIEAKNLELARLQFHLEQAAPPDVADSPAWSATVPTVLGTKLDVQDALVKVLAYGGRLRRCTACRAPATNSWAVEYEWRGDDVLVCIAEDCLECGEQIATKVTPHTWACMEAMRAWEGARTARALFKAEAQNSRDLGDLDGES